eukprot:gene28127-34939_t
MAAYNRNKLRVDHVAPKLEDDFVEYVNGNPVMNFAMEYFPQTLYDVCRFYTNEGLDVPELKARLYSYQLFHALAHLHGIGFIHRDVKVENVLVNLMTSQVKLCDFGNSTYNKYNHIIYDQYDYLAPEMIFYNLPIVGGPLETSQREFVTCHETRLTAKEICGHSSFRVLHTPENVELFHRVVESLPLLEEIKPPLWSKQVVVVGWQGF